MYTIKAELRDAEEGIDQVPAQGGQSLDPPGGGGGDSRLHGVREVQSASGGGLEQPGRAQQVVLAREAQQGYAPQGERAQPQPPVPVRVTHRPDTRAEHAAEEVHQGFAIPEK